MMGKTSGMTGKSSGEVRDDEEVIAGLPCLCLEMSWGRHVFLIFLEMSGKSSLPCLCLRPVGEDMSSVSLPRCWRRHPEMLGRTSGRMGMTCLPCLP